jgi:tetratricopeptide (TPR) repeat protein
MNERTLRRSVAFMALILVPLAAGAATEPLAPGIQLFESRRYEEARKFFEPYAARNAKNADAFLYLGRTYFYLGRYEAAIAPLEKAATLAPERTLIQLWLARAYGRTAQQASLLKQAGLARKSKAAYEKAVALDPANLEARSDLIQYYLLAPGFLGGSVEKAKEQAAEIRRRDALRGVEAFVTVHLHQKNFAAAERETREAIQRTPAEPRLHLLLAGIYLNQEKWDLSLEALEAVLKSDPGNRFALYQIGRTGALSGKRLDRAEESLKRYLQQPPGADEPPLANAHFRLGMVYAKKGNQAQARSEYQTALKLDPKLKEAKEALEKLD